MAQPPVLLTKSDFDGLVTLTRNLDFGRKIEPHIRTCQDLQLSDWMGVDFLQAVISNPSAYDDLLNGTNYTVKDTTYYFGGLKKILVYLTMSKAVWDIDIEHTDTGTVFKTNEYSEHVSSGVLSRLSTQHYNTALAYWNKAIHYLDNTGSYTLWRNNKCCERTGDIARPRISAVGNREEIYNHEYTWPQIRR